MCAREIFEGKIVQKGRCERLLVFYRYHLPHAATEHKIIMVFPATLG
jgi:hypothetical protein